MRLRPATILTLTTAMLLGACEQQIGPVPTSPAELRAHRVKERIPYPRYTIVQHNLQRALDDSLPADQRSDSLRLADHLGGGEPGVRARIGDILGDPKAPDALRQAALTFLLRRDAPGLGEILMRHWDSLERNPRMREAALAYLENHPDAKVLSGIVQFWAEVPPSSSAAEMRYRRVVERASRKPWAQALLDGINDPVFDAKGSAIQVLSRRLSRDELRSRIEAMRPGDPAMVALQEFQRRFNYIPADGPELYTAVVTMQSSPDSIADAERLAASWNRRSGYRFNIRDFHLLSQLSRDSLRDPLTRRQLTESIGDSMRRRRHVVNGTEKPTGRFHVLADSLTEADLWNILLLGEMLGQPRMQRIMTLVADGDRKDQRSQWGGLVFYEAGQAEPKLSPPDLAAGENDLGYTPSAVMVRRGRNSLCRFVGHFEAVRNVKRAGPTPEELSDAASGNYYGLVLTSVSEQWFAAHYYNPRRLVVSLGIFPFRR